MKVAISSTYDDKYLFFLPITTWCWNRIGVDVICFMPRNPAAFLDKRMEIILRYLPQRFQYKMEVFECPEHKQATYAQCARLFAACLDLPENEILITSDVDMCVFKQPPYLGGFTIWGSDLVPKNQLPICYISATVKDWRQAFQLEYGALKNEPNALAGLRRKTYQECLDELLGERESSHMRSDFWSLDQEIAHNKISTYPEVHYIDRSNGQNQFAQQRIDRDDSYWRDRLSPSLVDAHLWRNGYTDENFSNIMELLKYVYPDDDLSWIENYRNEYVKLL